MYLQMWMLFVVALSLADNTHGIIPDDSTNLNEPGKYKCADRQTVKRYLSLKKVS